MDYVRKILVLVRKYHFWGLAALVAALLGGLWTAASGKFSDAFEKRQSEVKQDFTDMHQVAGLPSPVNELVFNALRNVHEQLQKNVMRGWRYLYGEQTKNNPLPSLLGDEFKEEWEKRGPKEELPPNMLDHYWNFIQQYFPELLKKADIRRPKNPERFARAGLGPGGAGLMEGAIGGAPTGAEQIEYEGKVVWDDANYKQLLARFQWTQQPTTLQVRLAQEDLWVIETLLSIIKELNQGATSHYNAVVKRIFALDVGQYATKAFYEARDALGLRGVTVAAAAGGTGVPGETPPGAMPGGAPGLGPGAPPPAGVPGAAAPGMLEGPMPGMQGPGMPPGMLEGPGMTPGLPSAGAAALDALYQYRYVDQNEQPVPVENGAPKHPFAEFKMMPIRMRLLMDQRKIPELLVLCANSKMPIEVRQVRLNPGRAAKVNYAAARTASPGLMTPGMGPAMEGMGPMGPMGPGVETMGPQPTPGGIGEGPGMGGPLGGEGAYQGPYDVVVEVLGIIYIYEPPDETKLGSGAAASGETATTAKPSEGETQPAASPETPTGPASPTPAKPPSVPPAGTPGVPEGGQPTAPGGTPTAPPAATPPGPATPGARAPDPVPDMPDSPAAGPGAAPPASPAEKSPPAAKPDAKSPAPASEGDLPPVVPTPPASPPPQP